MTIATGFIAKSATVAGVVCAGLTTLSFSQQGQVVDLRSDGELFAKVTPIIPGNIEVEIETRDLGVAIEVGTTGALSAVADKMTGGIAMSGTLTFAASSVTVRAVTRSDDINGQAVVKITAVINSATGAASGLTITAA
jgi:hypothetical protein